VVAIYLDANILIKWRRWSHLERVAVSIASQQMKQLVVVPEMAADEAEAYLARSLQAAEGELRKAQRAVNELFDRPALFETYPDVSSIVNDWSQSLMELFVVKTHPSGAAEQALRREVLRLAPARPTFNSKSEEDGATGARDALIWLTILDDMRERDEPAHLITSNKDFVGANGLRSELRDEIPAGRDITAYKSAFEFLKILGEARPPDVEVTVALLEERVKPVIETSIPWSNVLPKAVFGAASVAWRYTSRLSEVTPLRVKGARRWAGADAGITVVDSEWSLVASVSRAPRFEDGPEETRENVGLHGTLQLYIADGDGELPQIISGRFSEVDGRAFDVEDLRAV
jgi:hypothetical protein